MPISRFNNLTKQWENVAGGDAAEISLNHDSFQAKNVHEAMSEMHDSLAIIKKNIKYLYHNKGNGGGGSSSLPSVPNQGNVKTGIDGRKSLGIVEKIEGDSLTVEELNAIIEVINTNSEMFFKAGNITVPTETGGSEIIQLKTAEDILNFIRIYGTSLPNNNLKPQLVFDKKTFVFTQRSVVEIPFTIADSDGGRFTVSFTMTSSSGSTSLHKFTVDSSAGDASAPLHMGENKITIPSSVIDSNTQGTYRLTDFRVYDSYFKSSDVQTIKVIIGNVSVSEFNPPSCVPLNEVINIPVRYSSVLQNITIKTTTLSVPLSGGLSLTEDNSYDIDLGEGYSPTQINTFNIQVFPTVNTEYTIGLKIIDTETGGEVISTSEIKKSFAALDNNSIYVLPTLNKNVYNRYDAITASLQIVHSANVSPLYDIFITSDGNVETSLYGIDTYSIKGLSLSADTEFDSLSLSFKAVYKGTDAVLVPIVKTTRINILTPEYGSVYNGTGSVLWLDAKGRSNSETPDIRGVWPNKIKNYAQHPMVLKNIRTQLNGWEPQKNGLEYTGNCLELSAGAYGIIEGLKPFEKLSVDDGLTFEVCMHSLPASSIDTTLLSLGEITNVGGVVSQNGIFITPTEIQVYLGNKKIVQPNSNDTSTYLKNGNINQNEEEFLHITIVYKKDGDLHDGKDLCLIYVNGIISNASSLPAYSSLNHLGQLILNGYRDYDGKIKGHGSAKFRFVRIYNTALSKENVLQNYIASMYNTTERDYVVEANRQLVANEQPYISKMYMEGDGSAMTSSLAVQMDWTFVKGRENELYENSMTVPEFIPNPIAEDGVTVFEDVPASTKWQGSSSLDYMIKNYTADVLPLQQNLSPIKFRMTNEFPAADTFQMKANYIDSSAANNIACAKIANQIWGRNWSTESLKTIQKYSDPEMTKVVYPNPMFLIPNGNGVTVSQKYPMYSDFHALNGFPYVMFRDFINKNQANTLVKNKFGGIYMCNLQHNADLYGFESYTNSTSGAIGAGPWARHMYYKHDNNGTSTFSSQLSAYVGQFDPRAMYAYSQNGKTRAKILYKQIDGVNRSIEECLGFELLMCYSQEAPSVIGLGLRNGKDHNQWKFNSLQESNAFAESLDPFTDNNNWKYKWQWNPDYMYSVGNGKEPIRKVNSQDTYTYNSNIVGNIKKFLVEDGSKKYLLWDEYAALAYHQNLEYINASMWVANASDADFANPEVFNRFIRLDSCIDYMIMCMLFQMSDSLGRNLIMVSYDKQDAVRTNGVLTSFKSADKHIFYPHFYDMDTAFGTDVYGTISDPYLPWPHAVGGYEGLDTRDQTQYRITSDKEMLQKTDVAIVLEAFQGTSGSSSETKLIDAKFKYAFFNLSGEQVGSESETLLIPEGTASVKAILYVKVGNVDTEVAHKHIPVNIAGRSNIAVTNNLYTTNNHSGAGFSWIVNNDSKIMKEQSPKVTVKSFVDGVLDEVVSYQIEVNGLYVDVTNVPSKIDSYYPFTVCKAGQDLVFNCIKLDGFNVYCNGDSVKIKAITTSGAVVDSTVSMKIVSDFVFSYNCVSNNLWRRLCKHYSKAIMARYSELRKGYVDANGTANMPILTVSNVIDKYCTQIVNRIGERYYNDDAFLKYFGTEFDTESEIATKRAFVGNARGNKFLYVKDFLNKRMVYVDSILGYIDETSATKGSIAIRHGYQGVMKLKLASVAPSFITLQWAQGVTEPLFLPGNNQVVEIEYDYTGSVSSGQTWMKLMNCSNLSLIEGLSDKKIEKIELNGLAALKKIDISLNSFVQENPISFINCVNIEELYMSQINGQGKALSVDISGFEQLRIVDVSNSVIAVTTFASNKLLESINITNNVYTTSLDLSGNLSLTSLKITPENLTSLNISDTTMDFSNIERPAGSTWKLLETLNATNSKTTGINTTGASSFMPALKTLLATGCPDLKVLDLTGTSLINIEIDKQNIQSLILKNGSADIDFSTGEWISIETIDCNGNTKLSSIGKVERNQTNILPALTTLDVRNCPKLLDLNVSGITTLVDLKYDTEVIEVLDLSFVDINLLAQTASVKYSKLKSLSLIRNFGVTTLNRAEGSFGSIESLYISDCRNLTSVRDMFKNREIDPVLNSDFLARCLSLTHVCNLFEGSYLSTVPAQMFLESSSIKSLSGCFKNCRRLREIANGVLDSLPALEDITEVFYGANLQYYTDIIDNDIYGEPFVAGKETHNVFQGQNIFGSCPKLKTATSAFRASELSSVPSSLFAGSLGITDTSYCFSDILNAGSEFGGVKNKLSIPTTMFVSMAALTNASGVFKGTFMQNVHNNILSDCPKLVGARELFYGSSITALPSTIFSSAPLLVDLNHAFAAPSVTAIPANFASNLPSLTNVTNIFLGSKITALTAGFLKKNKISAFKFADLGLPGVKTINADMFSENTVLSDISGLFSGTQIASTPNGFLSNNAGINKVANLTANSVLHTIGTDFLKFNSVTTTANLFQNRTSALTIGAGFMQNSEQLTVADSMFEGCTGITTVPVNVMSNCPNLVSAVSMFKNATGLTSIGSGLLQNVPRLESISDIFKGTKISVIPDGVLVNPNITTFKFSDILTHKVSISTTFLMDSSLTNIDNLFTGTAIETVPNAFFSTHEIVNPVQMFFNSSISYIGNDAFGLVKIDDASMMFNGCPVVIVGNNFMASSGVKKIDNILSGSQFINGVGNNFMGSKENLVSATSAFEGSSISYIGGGFLTNSPLLVSITNIFNDCQEITSLPADFLKMSPLINSLVGVFTGTGITEIPDDFCCNNTGINYLTNVFVGSNITRIGNGFMKNNTGVIDISGFVTGSLVTEIGNNFMSGASGMATISNIFNGNTTIKSIGKLFLSESSVQTANHAFYGATSLQSVGSGILYNCGLTSAISMFENCTSLNKIGEYTEWYDANLHNSYLYTKEVDITKCNVAGQQAEVALFCSVPYLESEYDSFTGLSNLANMANIFKGTGLIRTPKGFLKNVSGQSTPASLSSLLVGSQIRFFNPDLYSLSVMTNINTLFDNTNIIAIPTGFMSSYPVGTEVQIQWSGKKTIQFVAYIPKTFLRNCTLATPTLSHPDAYFQTTNVRMLQNDWLNWENPTKYWVDGGGTQIGPSWNYSELVNIPRGYFRYCIKQLRFSRETTLYADKMDTIIPEFAFNTYNGTGVFYSDSYYNPFYSGSIKGVVPKTFLNYDFQIAPDGIKNLFYLQNIIGVENGCLTKSITTSSQTLHFGGVFQECRYLKYIPSTLFSGYDTTKQITFALIFKNCLLLTKFPDILKTNQKIISTNGMFYGCTGITNTSGDMDVMIVNLTNQPLLTDTTEMFRGCTSLTRLPDNTLSNSQALTNCTNIFNGCTQLQNIPSNIFSYGTTSICNLMNLFYGCAQLQSFPADFLRYVKAGNCSSMFTGCSNLTGVIPSNFLLASNGTCTQMYYMFQSCPKITGFENNVWNFNDFSQVVEMQFMFNGSGITSIPPSFCNNNTFLKATRCEQIFGSSKITTVPNDFMNNCPLLSRVDTSFGNTNTLLSIGTGIYENCPKVTNANTVFQNDINLTGIIPVSFLRNSTLITGSNYVFYGTKITGIESGNVYERLTSAQSSLDFKLMFYGCASFSGVLPSLWTLYPNVTATNKNGTFVNCYNAQNWYLVPVSWGGTLQRTIAIMDSATLAPIQDATVQIGSNYYMSDQNGFVRIGNAQAISVTITKSGYKTVITTFPSSSDVVVNYVNLIKS